MNYVVCTNKMPNVLQFDLSFLLALLYIIVGKNDFVF